MPAIVTTSHRIIAADYFENNIHKTPTYIFISGTDPWDDEESPDPVDNTTSDIAKAYDGLIGVKRVASNDVISVLPRIDWTSGVIYDEYRDDVDQINSKNPDTDEFYSFYVVTDEFGVYKCISNNYGVASTTKPSGTSVTNFTTPDGYVWKYMYTIKSEDAFKYMTPNWVPCYTITYNDGSSQWITQEAAVGGTIDNIYVTDGGTSYTSANAPTVTVTGDGSGCVATAQVNDLDGTVEKIIINDVGEGYTYATVSIVDGVGSGVGSTAVCVISPKNGHGSDARKELGAVYKMLKIEFQGNEGGVLETDVMYRKAGLISQPLSNDDGLKMVVVDASLYLSSEEITGETSGSTADISSIDYQRNYLYLENVSGTFVSGENISSQVYNSTEVIQFSSTKLPLSASVVSDDDILPLSGDIMYILHREFVSRGLNQTEEVRFVINF